MSELLRRLKFPPLLLAFLVLLQGLLEFARYYGYYPGAEEVDQPGAALKGQNLEDFKGKFR